MCTVTKIKPERKIAKEDIITYKRVKIDYKYKFLCFKFGLQIYSRIKNFKYELNKIYETSLSDFIKENDLYYSYLAFYSYKNETYFNDNTSFYCNVECVIPKDSEYIVAEDDCGNIIYHSNRIKIVKILY